MTPSMLADNVEHHILFRGGSAVSTSELLDWLGEDGSLSASQVFDAALLDHDQSVEGPRTARSDFRASRAEGSRDEDVLVQDVLFEFERRGRIVGNGYPFRVVESRVIEARVASWREAAAYSFMLALSTRLTTGFTAELHQAARLFERLVIPALRRLWGGEAAHFGWPRDAAELAAFPIAFRALIRDHLKERLNVSVEELPSRFKDLEVDAVAWRPLDDRRGQTVLLCQCAIGADWEQKGVHVAQWAKIVTFAVEPYKAMAFPFVPEVLRDYTDVDWELMCGKAGLPLDRLRIAYLLDGEELSAELLDGLVDWISAHEDLLRAA